MRVPEGNGRRRCGGRCTGLNEAEVEGYIDVNPRTTRRLLLIVRLSNEAHGREGARRGYRRRGKRGGLRRRLRCAGRDRGAVPEATACALGREVDAPKLDEGAGRGAAAGCDAALGGAEVLGCTACCRT